MDADRTDVGQRSTDDRALGIRIVGDRVGRHAGAISSVEEASRAAEFTRADSGREKPPRAVRLGRNASIPGSTPWYGPSTWSWEAEAGWPAGSEQDHALFAERDLEEQDDGSWLRAAKSWPRRGVFHCYIAAYSHERPHRRRKPSVEGRAGPWEASGVRRCYVAFFLSPWPVIN